MEQLDIVLDQKQAKVFARAIYRDVSAYICAHKEEFEQFLLEEKRCGCKMTKIRVHIDPKGL